MTNYFLTAAEAEAQVAASKKHGAERYSVAKTAPGFKVWDHEDAEYMTDRDGADTFTEEDARELRMELIG